MDLRVEDAKPMVASVATATSIGQCPICGRSSLEPFAEDRGHRFVRCGDCTFAFIDAEDVRRGMIDEYAVDCAIDPEHIERYGYQRAAVYRQALGLVERALPHGGRLLDVGCQFGIFLELARRARYEVTGVELTRQEAVHARHRLGCTVYDRPLEDLGLPADSFDMVTYLDVVEHLEDPVGQLREAHRLLKPGGWIIVRVPNLLFHAVKMRVLEGLFGHGRAQAWCRTSTFCGLQAPAHMNWFTARSLALALSSAGFAPPQIVLGRPELIKPTSLKRHAVNALKRVYCGAATVIHLATRVPIATLVALARKPGQ